MREFLWSEEMADACVFVMENVNFNQLISISSLRGGGTTTKQSHEITASTNNEVRNTHINIGTGKEVSIKQLAELIKSKLAFKGDLVFNTSKPDGTMLKLTDPSKLHKLGWHHKIEVEEGIEKLYKWYLSV